MNICFDCSREMKCERNGVVAVWRQGHCYAGDLFKCPDCGAQVLSCTSTSFHNPNALSGPEGYVLNMDDDTSI